MSEPGSPLKFWNNRSIQFTKRAPAAASRTDRAFRLALRDPRPVPFGDKLRAAAQLVLEEDARRGSNG